MRCEKAAELVRRRTRCRDVSVLDGGVMRYLERAQDGETDLFPFRKHRSSREARRSRPHETKTQIQVSLTSKGGGAL